MEPQEPPKYFEEGLVSSSSINSLTKALSAFQGEITNPKKDTTNSFFKSKYSSLDGVLNTVRPVMAKHGLSLAQFPSEDNKLITFLFHSSGEFIKSTFKMVPKDNTPQGQGSALTYARRYVVSAVLGIASEEDDDSNAASQSPKVQKVFHNQHQDHRGDDVGEIITYGADLIEDEPEPEAPVVPKKAPSVLALKKSIGQSLKDLGMPCGSPEEATASIKKTVDLEYIPENLKQIADTLKELVTFEATK